MANSIKVNGTINAKGLSVRTILNSDGNDYVSLTDLAKFKSENANMTICNWMRLHDTISFLGLWEELHNPDFKPTEFEGFRQEAGGNAFVMSPKKGIEGVNAIGIVSRAGRYGGTYAHSDIAFEFASWLSPEFKLYVIKDYQRLKKAESNHLSLDWSARRELAKTNYRTHTDAIKENLIDETLPAQYQKKVYADEADVINVALFGMTAKEWRDAHPRSKGNIRDYANILQLIILSNLENTNANLIEENVPQQERLQRLRSIAARQLKSIQSAPSAKRLETRFEKKD